jgi:hypothetical protein
MKIELNKKLLTQIKNSPAGKIPKALAHVAGDIGHVGKDIGTAVGKEVSRIGKSGNSLGNSAQMQAQVQKKTREQNARNWINSHKR